MTDAPPPLPPIPKIQLLCESCLRDRNKGETCNCGLIYGCMFGSLVVAFVGSWVWFLAHLVI